MHHFSSGTCVVLTGTRMAAVQGTDSAAILLLVLVSVTQNTTTIETATSNSNDKKNIVGTIIIKIQIGLKAQH